jgi:hypothetical protein
MPQTKEYGEEAWMEGRLEYSLLPEWEQYRGNFC